MPKSKKSIASRPRNILLVFNMGSCAGRRHLAGAFRYIAQGKPWNIRLFRGGYDDTEELLEAVSTGDVDGIICARTFPPDILSAIDARRIPVATIDAYANDAAFPARGAFIDSDDYGIGIAGVDHLMEFGNFRSFGFVPSDVAGHWSMARMRGFSKQLASKGRSCAIYEWSRMPLAEWLMALDRPVAIMAAHDGIARKVVETAKSARLKIPGDIALIGTDDDELLCEYATPRLSSIRPGHEECGFAAAKALDALLHGKTPPPQTIPLERITDRESIAHTMPAAHLVEDALQCIARKAKEGIGVDDVAQELHVSRRLLSLRFAELQGISVHDAIVRQRLSEVKHLLKNTRLPIMKITGRCGFGNVNYLKRLFKDRFGMTMREWRAQDRNHTDR